MEVRGVVLLTLALGGAVIAAACSGPDPGAITFSERQRGISSGDTGSSGSSGTGDGGASDGGSSGTDGGSSGGPVNAFTGAPAYAQPASTDPSDNAAHGGDGNPAGQDCMGCHGPNGGAGNKWGIGGTVYTNGMGAAPVANAEIRIVDPTGKEIAKTYSNADGNFWVDAAAIAGGIPNGSKVGVRNAARTRLMSTALTGNDDGGCQKGGCHVQGGVGRVYLDP